MASQFMPKRGVALTFEVPGFFSQADPTTYKTNPTIAAGDFKISKDGGAWAALTNTPTVIGADTMVQFVLTATEMTADRVAIRWQDAAGAEWIAGSITFYTAAMGADDLASQASVDAVDNFIDTEIADIQARLPAALVGGRMDSSVGAMAANVMTAAAAAGDLTTELQAGLATAAAVAALNNLSQADVRTAVGLASANLDTQLAAIAAYIDTEVAAILAAVDTETAAIKAKTDLIPAAPAAVGDIPTANQVRDAVFAKAFGAAWSNKDFEAMVKIIAAMVVGRTSGAGTTSEVFKTPDNSATVATVGNDGTDRTSVTLA